jgi:hypothetical protein
MDTLNINSLLRKSKGFVGTFPRDMMPKYFKRLALIIVNTDTSKDPGEH